MQPELTNVKEAPVDETSSFADEFTFELEELDGNRAITFLLVALDPPACHC